MTEPKPRSKVVFKDPPVDPVRYDWAAIAAKLKARPGEWALIFEQDRTSLASSIRSHDIKSIQISEGFEVRTRNNNKSAKPPVCDLWLCYNPKGR